MSKIYDENVLSREIEIELTWRLKEISDLKTAALQADTQASKVLSKALIVMCYSHWEGYIRFTARRYLAHVASRRFRYEELESSFIANLFLSRLGSFVQSKPSASDRYKIVDEIRAAHVKRFSHYSKDIVNTRANLNSQVLSEICLICSIDFGKFSENVIFIDKFLVERRNCIAHGDDLNIPKSDLDGYCEKTISLMRQFGNEVDNRAQLRLYLRAKG